MLKITERKNTTRAGLNELAKLVDALNQRLASDLNTMNSEKFPMKILRDNGHMPRDYHYQSWINHSGRWTLDRGIIKLHTIDGDGDEEAISMTAITSISFTAAVTALQKLIHGYNDRCMEKDAKIQEFLDICEAYHAGQPTG